MKMKPRTTQNKSALPICKQLENLSGRPWSSRCNIAECRRHGGVWERSEVASGLEECFRVSVGLRNIAGARNNEISSLHTAIHSSQHKSLSFVPRNLIRETIIQIKKDFTFGNWREDVKGILFLQKTPHCVWHFDWIFYIYGATRWFHSRSSRKFQLCNCSVTH